MRILSGILTIILATRDLGAFMIPQIRQTKYLFIFSETNFVIHKIYSPQKGALGCIAS